MTATVPSIVSLPPALELLDDQPLKAWLRTQPAPVLVIVDLAAVEHRQTIVGYFIPEHAAAVDEIAGALDALNDASWMDERDWLHKWFAPGVHAFDAQALVERLCEQHRETVKLQAQLVASLIEAKRAS